MILGDEQMAVDVCSDAHSAVGAVKVVGVHDVLLLVCYLYRKYCSCLVHLMNCHIVVHGAVKQ